MSLVKEAMSRAAAEELTRRLEQARTPQEKQRILKEYRDMVGAGDQSRLTRAVQGMGRGGMVGVGASGLMALRGMLRGSVSPSDLAHAPPELLALLGAPVALGATLGGIQGALSDPRKRHQKLEGLPKRAYFMESKYNPLAASLNAGQPDVTLAELSNPHMKDKLRKELMKERIRFFGTPRTRPSSATNAFTAGGRSMTVSDVEAKHRPAIIAHELGHHKHKDVSKGVLTGLGGYGASVGAGLAAGAATGNPLAIPLVALGTSIGTGWLKGVAHSERAERRADREAAALTSPKEIASALKYIHDQGLAQAEKEMLKQKPAWRNSKKHKEMVKKRINRERSVHYDRPEGKMGRAWKRISYGATHEHPPLWSRLETIKAMEGKN